MGSQSCHALSTVWLTLAFRVKTLDKHGLLWRHVLHVPQLVPGRWSDRVGFTFAGAMSVVVRDTDTLHFGLTANFIAGCVVSLFRVWQDLLSAVIILITKLPIPGRIQKIHLDEVFGRSGAPVNDSKREVAGRMAYGSPDVDELVALLEQAVDLFSGQVSPDPRFCGGRGLVNMDLLDRLARGARVMTADGVVENGDFFHLGPELVAQQSLDLGIVGVAHTGIVG